MINKLPRWIWVGGSLLAFVGGMINVVCLLSVYTQAVGHLTGPSAQVTITLIDHGPASVVKVGSVIGAFFIGAVMSGWLIQSTTLEPGRRYSTALWIETAALCVATVLLQQNRIAGLYLCALACGLQNAMASHYSGAIVRTTHVTGMFTDLGNIVGQRLRGIPMDTRRSLLCVLIIAGYLGGGITSAILMKHAGCLTLLIPAAITATLAVLYQHYRSRLADYALSI